MKKLFFLSGFIFVAIGGAIYFAVAFYRERYAPEIYIPTDWALVNIVGTNSAGYVYISYLPKPIKSKVDVIQVDEDYEFKMAHSKTADQYPSVKYTKEYNCKTNEFTIISFSAYSQSHNQGDILASSNNIGAWNPSTWAAIKSDTPESMLLPIFCGGK